MFFGVTFQKSFLKYRESRETFLSAMAFEIRGPKFSSVIYQYYTCLINFNILVYLYVYWFLVMIASRRKVLFQGETHCNVSFHSFVLDSVTFSVSEKTEEIVSVLPLIEKAAKNNKCSNLSY